MLRLHVVSFALGAGFVGACTAPSSPPAPQPAATTPRAAAAPPGPATPAPRPTLQLDIPTAQRTLRNGLEVIVAPKAGSGIVEVHLFYRVGSRDESLGESGLAHLFEHMMFNGAKRYGPKQFDAVLERAGGYGMAVTTTDYTCYFTAVPPEQVATALDLEADRMADLDLNAAMLDRERQAVLQERREGIENSPEASLAVLHTNSLYTTHSYRWPVIGWVADIERYDVAACKRFYAAHYAPDNAVLVLAGGIEPEHGFALAEAAFGKHVASGHARPHVAPEPARVHQSRIDLEREAGAPLLLIGFVGAKASDPDFARLDLLAQVLVQGATARLPQRLIRRERIVNSMHLDHDWSLDAGPFTLSLVLPPEQSEQPVLEAVFAELEALARDGVSAQELARAQTGASAALLRGLATASGRADLIGRYQVQVGPHRQLFELPQRYASIDSAQIQDVCRRLLARDRAAIAMLRPRAAEARK